MLDFDRDKTFTGIEEEIARTTNPQHLKMLEVLLKHARCEVGGDLEGVLSTLAPYPMYKGVRATPGVPEPEGFEQVRDFYVNDVFAVGVHFFEATYDRIVVGDNAIVTEGPMRSLRWGQDLIRAGMQVDDPDGTYLITMQTLLIWPYDEEGRLIGEESYRRPPFTGEKVVAVDVPEGFRDYIRQRKLDAAAIA